MDYATSVLLAQTAMLFFITAWLTTGALENLFRPNLNRVFTSEVLSMERMRKDYPDAFADVSSRAITSPTAHKLLFRLIVLWELAAMVLLWIGFVSMVMALFGALDAQTAKAWGVLGALAFTSVWAGFLVAGNWFCYWFCHEGAQNTHFQMTLWGFAVLIFLVVG